MLGVHLPGPPRSPAVIEISSPPPNTHDFPRFGAGASATDEGNPLALHPTDARAPSGRKRRLVNLWRRPLLRSFGAGGAGAFTGYVQKFGSGAHVAGARKRAAALETQGRREVPSIDIQKTCQAAAGAMVSLMGGTTTEQDVNACLDSEQKSRDQIVKDRATYSAADKKQCM